MGNSTVKFHHQATEVRLRNRRKVNRPLRPIPSRANEAGSGTPGGVTPPVEKPWLVKEKVVTPLPLVGPTTVMSFWTEIKVSGSVNGVVSDPCPGAWTANGVLLSWVPLELKMVSPIETEPVPVKPPSER